MRLTTKVAAAAATSGDARPSGWRTDRPATEIPTLDVARFQMTIHGYQTSNFGFKWVPGNACGQQAEAALVEHWNYARGKAVVMEFSKIGPRAILLRRKGRPPGDAAFAAPGDLTRHATGYFDMGTFPGCGGWHSLIGPDCDQRYKVQSEMHLAWFNGKLDLEKDSSSRQRTRTPGRIRQRI